MKETPFDTRAILECLPSGVVILSPAGKVVYANSAMKKMVGDRNELEGVEFASLLRPEDGEGLMQSLAESQDLHGQTELQLSLHGEPFAASISCMKLDPAQSKWLVTLRPSHELSDPEKALVESLRQVTNLVVLTDDAGKIIYANEAFEKATGYSQSEFLGKQMNLLRSDHHDAEFFALMWQTLLSGRPFNGVVINRRRDGAYYYEEKAIAPLKNHQGQVLCHLATGEVVGHTEVQLDSSQLFLHSMVGGSGGLWDWDLATDKVYFSNNWLELLLLGKSDIAGTIDDWLMRIHHDDTLHFHSELGAIRRGERSVFEVKHRLRRKDGSWRWFVARGLATKDRHGQCTRISGSLCDIDTQLQVQENLSSFGRDPLTGLLDRTRFLERVSEMSAASQLRNERFAVLCLDLDRFKVVNDSLGHERGDELLVAFAKRLRRLMGPSTHIARLGGDEFALLLPSQHFERQAQYQVEAIQETLNQPFNIGDREVFVTTSIGIVFGGPNPVSPADLLRDGDTALYHAKSQGRNCAATFDSKMHSRALRQLDLENALRKASQQDELEVVYQPIVDLNTGKISGFEALLRWNHSTRGAISPAEFIPIAEETGLINDIGLWTLRQSCKALRLWQRHFANPKLTMAVNLSGVQFLRLDLITKIDQILREQGLDPMTFKLEITESVIMEHAEYADAMLAQLRAQNIRLSVDDFGTGYSSMAYLRRYPIDTVKIDRSFVHKMVSKIENQVIVKTIVDMAHNLNMDIIAEGVETSAQLEKLREMGCEFGQGFFFSKPLQHSKCEALLSQDPVW